MFVANNLKAETISRQKQVFFLIVNLKTSVILNCLFGWFLNVLVK